MIGFIRNFKFLHVPSNTFVEVETYGQGTDTNDKAANAAMTTAKKYALLDVLLLITGDDPDLVESPPPEKKAEPHWKINLIEAVLLNTHIEQREKAMNFLENSGLSRKTTVKAVTKFAKTYPKPQDHSQGGY
jgi:hypothetical protein